MFTACREIYALLKCSGMHTFAYMTVAMDGYSNPIFDFCDRLRKVRREVAHMTQKEMAHELQVGDKAYEAWEAGRNKPSADDLITVAKLIADHWPGVTASWVLGVEDPTPPKPPGGRIHPLFGVEKTAPKKNNGTLDYQNRTLRVA